VKRKMKNWCKKKWVALEAILKLLQDSQWHTVNKKSLNTADRKQYSMPTKKSELKRFRKTEMHKREKNGEKKHSPYIHLFFGMGLAVICFMFLAGSMSVVSAAPVITDWSNSGTNDQDTVFLVNHGDTITFSVTVNEDADYQWVVNNVDQNNNAPNFTWTLPSENGIWRIHVRATNEAEEARVVKLMEELQGYDFPKFNQEMKNALFTSQSQIEWVVSSSVSRVSSASSTLSALSSPTFTIEVKPGRSIQAAIDAVPPEGGIVKLAAGTFTVDSTIRINRSNLVLCGEGKDKTTVSISQNANVIQVSPYEDIEQEIVDLFNTPGKPFDESYCTLSDVTVKDIHIHGFTTTQPPDVQALGKGCGVITGWVKNCTFSNLWIENCFLGLQPHMSYYTLAKDNLVENNYENWDTYLCRYATITGNTFRGATGNAHNFKANGGATGSLISNNIFGPGDGKLLLYGESNYCTVLNNIVHGNDQAGIHIHNSDHAIIKGNVIYGNGCGILMDAVCASGAAGEASGYHKIIGNIIYENDHTGRGTTNRYGIKIGCVAKNEIISNTIYGNPLDGIKIGGSNSYGNIIRNNIIANNGGYGINTGTSVDNTYNNIWNDASGSYNGASAGTGDISEEPLFADLENKDFHLKGTERRWTESGWVSDAADSPCIDAGDLSDDYGSEPVPNGERINIGAYGNTVEASASKGDPLDTIPPYTLAHSPAKNATGVAKDTNIVVHVKDDGVGVDQTSIVMTVEGITVTPTINGTINDYNISYTPSSPFDNGQEVNVTIDAQDLASPANVMSQDSYSFTIEPGDTTPPTITAHLPTGTSVPVGTTIVVTFSEAMNQTSAENAFSLSPSVTGSFSWIDNIMTFTPDSDLSYETTYAVTIDTSAEDLAGNNLEELYTWQFTTSAFSTTVYVATDGTGDYNCDGTDDHIEINQAISYIDSQSHF
jgi:parallel beta-helix repeat protein